MAEEKKKDGSLIWLSNHINCRCSNIVNFKEADLVQKSLLNQTLASDQWAFFRVKA